MLYAINVSVVPLLVPLCATNPTRGGSTILNGPLSNRQANKGTPSAAKLAYPLKSSVDFPKYITKALPISVDGAACISTASFLFPVVFETTATLEFGPIDAAVNPNSVRSPMNGSASHISSYE